jgi:hypothetical protein
VRLKQVREKYCARGRQHAIGCFIMAIEQSSRLDFKQEPNAPVIKFRRFHCFALSAAKVVGNHYEALPGVE